MVRSILAVVAGSVVWMITALGTDQLLLALFPHWFGEGGRVDAVPVLLLSLGYSLGFSVLAGYTTAYLARRSEVRHAFALAVLQFVMGVVATVQFWDTAPAWYHVVFLVLLIPANVLGGWLRARRKDHARTAQLGLA